MIPKINWVSCKAESRNHLNHLETEKQKLWVGIYGQILRVHGRVLKTSGSRELENKPREITPLGVMTVTEPNTIKEGDKYEKEYKSHQIKIRFIFKRKYFFNYWRSVIQNMGVLWKMSPEDIVSTCVFQCHEHNQTIHWTQKIKKLFNGVCLQFYLHDIQINTSALWWKAFKSYVAKLATLGILWPQE